MIAAITIKTFEAGFFISLFCAIMHGLASAFGESTILGLIKGFPSRLVGAFSSGTGFAGVFGAGIFLVLKPFMSDGFIFLIVVPLVLLYFMNAILVTRRKAMFPFVEETTDAQRHASSVRASFERNHSIGTHPKDEEAEMEDVEISENVEGIGIGDDAGGNISFSLANFRLIFGKVGWFLLNLSSVYFLEYC